MTATSTTRITPATAQAPMRKCRMKSLFSPSGSCLPVVGGRPGSGRPEGSVVVARQPLGLRDALVLDRRLEDGAGLELADEAALDFLPGGLARRVVVAPGGLERLAALQERRVVDEDVERALR